LNYFVTEAFDMTDDPIIEVIEGLDSYLESYEYIGTLPDIAMFSLTSISRLHALTIRAKPPASDDGRGDDDYITSCMDLVSEITDNLRSMNYLFFVYVGMDVRDLHRLSRLCNLKSITWVFSGDLYLIWGEGEAEEALADIFDSCDLKPKIDVMNGNFYLARGQDGRTRK
jgi:hypothetical protein